MPRFGAFATTNGVINLFPLAMTARYSYTRSPNRFVSPALRLYRDRKGEVEVVSSRFYTSMLSRHEPFLIFVNMKGVTEEVTRIITTLE
jgi:hypothetical protein